MKTPQLPQTKLAQALMIPNEVWLKREDLHHYGSHKGRSIPLMVDTYRDEGINSFVISSSGNAATCAARVVKTYNKSKNNHPLSLKIFVGENIDQKKLEILKAESTGDKYILIEQVDNPKQQAMQMEKEENAKWLRQSTDEIALLGYEELAKELAKIPELSAVFIPTSSGTTAIGLAGGFKKLGINPQIHIIQTTACHPMIEKEILEEPSLASAIVDKVAHRRTQVLEALKNSQGDGWVATNQELKNAVELVKRTTGIDISYNSALGIVGLQQAIKAGFTWAGGPIVSIITGP